MQRLLLPSLFVSVFALACSTSSDDGNLHDAGVNTDGNPANSVLVFPQAVSGAMWANPDVYPTITVRMNANDDVEDLSVRWNEQDLVATKVSPSRWEVELAIADMVDGFYNLSAVATTAEGEVTTIVELGLGREGQQLTNWYTVGRAGTPRIHNVGGKIWLTWTDRSEDDFSEPWMQQIDGAGRWLAKPVRIGHTVNETLDAFTAFGNESVGMFFEDLESGTPYHDYFQIVDMTGAVTFGPMALDPEGLYGVRGGEVTYDGSGYVVVWRVSAGSGTGELRWMRVDEATSEVVGPIAIASAGDSDPFGLNSRVSVQRIDTISLVSFVRYKDEILRTYFSYVDHTGAVLASFASGTATLWSDEAAVFQAEGKFLPMWGHLDLLNPSNNPPTRFSATKVGPMESVATGTMVLDQPERRSEFIVVEHPEHFATMAWLDQRTRDAGVDQGKIQLFAAQLSKDLGIAGSVVFDHAWFVEGTSKLSAIEEGGNVQLLWLDERHGSGIAGPKPELYFETVWH